MKIAVIGAGWYGCHIALQMLKRGFAVAIFDKSEDMISGASYRNQNRLHQGFHYPRCSKTRAQSKRGFHLFKKEYPNILQQLDYNLYAVADKSSIIDYETYKLIMSGDKLNFEDVTDVAPISVNQISGILDCEEEFICPNRARDYFTSKLSACFIPNTALTEPCVKKLQEEYDYVIDCTWGAFPSFFEDEVYYESCLYHIYSSEMIRNTALTVMDGNFFSIFPHGGNNFTVTCVSLIAQKISPTLAEASSYCKYMLGNESLLHKNRLDTEELVSAYLPSFRSLFSYVSPLVSVKTKFYSGTDSRYVKLFTNENRISILSGKIDTIFDADAMVMRYIRERL